MARLTRSFLFVVMFFLSVTCIQANNGVFDRISNDFGRATHCLNENIELVHLLEALAQFPYIFTVDSTDPSIVRLCTMISACSTGTKVAYELTRSRNERLIKTLVWDAPKVCLLLFAMGYDVIRFLDALKVAYKNKGCAKTLRVFKINQCANLSVEIFLRIIAFMSQQHVHQGFSGGSIACLASELADWLSIWRLLSRYVTYFLYTKQLELSVRIQTHGDDEADKKLDVLDHGELDEMTTLAEETAFKPEKG